MGLDGLKLAAALLVVFVAAACDSGGRPKRLLNGQPAAEFSTVHGSVIAEGRVIRRRCWEGGWTAVSSAATARAWRPMS